MKTKKHLKLKTIVLAIVITCGTILALNISFSEKSPNELGEIAIYNSRPAIVKGVKTVKLDKGENTIYFENLGFVEDLSIDEESISAVVLPKKSYGNFEGFVGKTATVKTAFSSKKGKILYYNDAKNWAMLYKDSILVSPEGNVEIDCEKCDYFSLKSPFVKINSDLKTTKSINYSYSLQNLSWKPLYVIKTGINPSLTLEAIISNYSQKNLDLKRVSLVSDGQNYRPIGGVMMMAKSAQNDQSESTTSQENIGDTDYLIFEKDLNITLSSDSEAKVKLLTTPIKPEVKYIINDYLNEFSQKKSGFADLVFEFENNAEINGAKTALPAGEIELKGDKYTSFASMQKSAFGEKIIVKARNSAEISFSREIENFKKTDKLTEFDIKISIKNTSNSEKNLVIIENFDQKLVPNCEKFCKITSSGIEIYTKIEANSEKIFEINLKRSEKIK